MKKIFVFPKVYLSFGMLILVLMMSGCGIAQNKPSQTTTEPLCYVSSHPEWPGTPCPLTATPTTDVAEFSTSSVSFVTPTTAPISRIKGWKIYIDNEYNFSFEYPPYLVLNGSSRLNNFFLDDKYGQHLISIDAGTNNFNSNSDIDKNTKSWNGYNEDKQKAVNVLLEKISDTTTTIGYLSRWKVYDIKSYDAASDTRVFKTKASGFENKAIFVSKLAVKGKRVGISFETKILPNWPPISVDLFRQIVSTFQFDE
jgi:hypothetical protein